MLRPRRIVLPAALAAALLAPGLVTPGLVLAVETADTRDALEPDVRTDLDRFARALEAAVRKVSRSSVAQLLGVGDACRGYHLKGYGAVFVIAPRLLPGPHGARVFAVPGHSAEVPVAPHVRVQVRRELDLTPAMRAMEEAMRRVDSEEIRAQVARSLEALRRAQEAARHARREEARALGDEAARRDELRAIEKQVKALEREAERIQQEAETGLERVSREVEVRVAAPRAPAAAAAGRAEVPPVPLMPPVPPAPWNFWFEAEDEAEPRSTERIVADVSNALTNAIEADGGRLRVLGPEDVVAVAVDFLPGDGFLPPQRPERTLVVRVRKKELDAHRAGRIAPEELRRRIEYVEY